jgi:hypothetical protein
MTGVSLNSAEVKLLTIHDQDATADAIEKELAQVSPC